MSSKHTTNTNPTEEPARQPSSTDHLRARDNRSTTRHQERPSQRAQTWRRFKRYKPALFGLGFISLLVILRDLRAWIAPYSTRSGEHQPPRAPPSAEHWLGNDDIGRDILSRIIYGTRVALIVGIGATSIAVTIGVLVGATAGYFGGKVDFLLSRLIDTLMAFPLLALLLTLSTVFGPSLRNVVIVIGCTVWASYARVVRAEVLSLRERDYILAARAIGTPDRADHHPPPDPQCAGSGDHPRLLAVGGIIILESALSFLGLGVQRPTASWGTMLSDGRDYLRNYPHIAIAPGIAIALTVLAFNLVGDGLRDALDPRQKT